MSVVEAEPEASGFTSGLAPAPKVKRLPSDLLDERKTFIRTFSERNRLDAPTIKQLMAHADRFGAEPGRWGVADVVETGAELGYDFDALVRLQEHCDRAHVTWLKKHNRFVKGSKMKSAEDRVARLLGINLKDEDGS